VSGANPAANACVELPGSRGALERRDVGGTRKGSPYDYPKVRIASLWRLDLLQPRHALPCARQAPLGHPEMLPLRKGLAARIRRETGAATCRVRRAPLSVAT